MTRKKAVSTVAKTQDTKVLLEMCSHQNKHVRHSARYKLAVMQVPEVLPFTQDCEDRIKAYQASLVAYSTWNHPPDTDPETGTVKPREQPAVLPRPNDAYWTFDAIERKGLMSYTLGVA